MEAARVAEGLDEVERLEASLLLDAVYAQTGFDFRGYAPASLRRRLLRRAEAEGCATLSALQERVLHDPDAMARLITGLTVRATTMFRDPEYWAALRSRVLPYLRTYPTLRVWHAGCSTGEEVYSAAIVLAEEGLAPRARVYATDIGEVALAQAREGLFPLDRVAEFTAGYHAAGGSGEFSRYYHAKYGQARFRPPLVKNVLFAPHNLATDGPFNEFNLIVCRNVLIYFKRELQHRVHALFHASLRPLGFLALGQKESLSHSPWSDSFEVVDERNRIYRKVA